MRILHVIDIGWLAGGAEHSVQLLQSEQQARGHDVRVLATDKDAAPGELFADEVVPHIEGNAWTRLRRYFFYRAAYRKSRGVIREFKPDVVHFHALGELSPSVVFGARGVPHVMTVHGPEEFTMELLPWQLPPASYRRGSYRWRDVTLAGRARYLYLRLLQRPMYLFALRRCSRFIAPSGFMQRALASDVSPGLVTVVHNGIDLPGPRELRSFDHFLFVGRLDAVKGVDVLLRAFAQVRQHHPHARLTIVGEGPQRAELESLSGELGTVGAVRFTGWLDNASVQDALVASTALVVPSVWPENLATVALEASAVGRAVIASRVGGLPEVVADGDTGLLVEPYDVDGLAAGMTRLIADPSLAESMGRRASASSQRFELDTFLRNLTAIYDEAVTAA